MILSLLDGHDQDSQSILPANMDPGKREREKVVGDDDEELQVRDEDKEIIIVTKWGSCGLVSGSIVSLTVGVCVCLRVSHEKRVIPASRPASASERVSACGVKVRQRRRRRRRRQRQTERRSCCCRERRGSNRRRRDERRTSLPPLIRCLSMRAILILDSLLLCTFFPLVLGLMDGDLSH